MRGRLPRAEDLHQGLSMTPAPDQAARAAPVAEGAAPWARLMQGWLQTLPPTAPRSGAAAEAGGQAAAD